MSQSSSHHDITRVLDAANHGDEAAQARLLTLVYDELHDLASRHMRGERPNHTLQPTILVHEAYLRLTGEPEVTWNGRAHFFGAAAEVMRRILVDHARARVAAKRGGNLRRLPLDDANELSADQPEEVIAIDEALEALAAIDAQRAEIVKLRFFGGLSVEQVAEALDVSTRTVVRQWQFARVWLYREIDRD